MTTPYKEGWQGYVTRVLNPYEPGTLSHRDFENGYWSRKELLSHSKNDYSEEILKLLKVKSSNVADSISVFKGDFDGNNWVKLPFNRCPQWLLAAFEMEKIEMILYEKNATPVFEVKCFDGPIKIACVGAVINIDSNGELDVKYP